MKRRRNLPSLGALRAFEAAARHGSFKQAAEELAVTPTSISHQVRSLEEQLGTRLFARFNRRVELTEAGRALAASLTRAFDTMDAAVVQVREGGPMQAEQRLVVAGNPGLLDCWLRARLPGFARDHPEIALELIPSDDTAAMLAGPADIALHFGLERPAGFGSRRLWSTCDFPVCAPSLASDLREPADLGGHTFLHEQSLDWWSAWLAAAQADIGQGWRRGPVFHSSALAIESAVAGDGIAMADELLAGDHLMAGRLVKPFGLTMHAGSALYLAWPAGTEPGETEERFAAWLSGQLQQFEATAQRLCRQKPFGIG